MPNESERFATIYAQGRPIGFLITRGYSQREGIEILQRRDVGKWPSRYRGENEKWPPDAERKKSPDGRERPRDISTGALAFPGGAWGAG